MCCWWIEGRQSVSLQEPRGQAAGRTDGLLARRRPIHPKPQKTRPPTPPSPSHNRTPRASIPLGFGCGCRIFGQSARQPQPAAAAAAPAKPKAADDDASAQLGGEEQEQRRRGRASWNNQPPPKRPPALRSDLGRSKVFGVSDKTTRSTEAADCIHSTKRWGGKAGATRAWTRQRTQQQTLGYFLLVSRCFVSPQEIAPKRSNMGRLDPLEWRDIWCASVAVDATRLVLRCNRNRSIRFNRWTAELLQPRAARSSANHRLREHSNNEGTMSSYTRLLCFFLQHTQVIAQKRRRRQRWQTTPPKPRLPSRRPPPCLLLLLSLFAAPFPPSGPGSRPPRHSSSPSVSSALSIATACRPRPHPPYRLSLLPWPPRTAHTKSPSSAPAGRRRRRARACGTGGSGPGRRSRPTGGRTPGKRPPPRPLLLRDSSRRRRCCCYCCCRRCCHRRCCPRAPRPRARQRQSCGRRRSRRCRGKPPGSCPSRRQAGSCRVSCIFVSVGIDGAVLQVRDAQPPPTQRPVHFHLRAYRWMPPLSCTTRW